MKKFSIANQYMFRRVMLEEEICKQFIYSVLGIKAQSIEYKNIEQTLDPALDLKSVRLDLFMRAEGKVYDIEMQCESERSYLQRLRYYQASIDSTLLEKGYKYEQMNETYIIYLCTFDPLGQGLSKYTIERRCLECHELDIYDGAHWVLLNAAAFEREPRKELRELLKYIKTGEPSSDFLVKMLDKAVTQVNQDTEWVKKMESVMNAYDDATWRGYSKGEEAGIAIGLQLGQEQVSKLTRILLDLDRIEDLKRSSQDEAFRNSLIEEFSL